jgi:hypothetical protein
MALNPHSVGFILLREAGKVDARSAAGWGAESREGSLQARVDAYGRRLGLRQPPTPHPAFGRLPQQSWGRETPRVKP